AGRGPKALWGAAPRYLSPYGGPGKGRDLRNMVEPLVIMAPRDIIGPEDLPPPLRTREGGTVDEAQRDKTLKEAREAFERAYILGELRAHEWNMTRTAERLGIARYHPYHKPNRYTILPH